MNECIEVLSLGSQHEWVGRLDNIGGVESVSATVSNQNVLSFEAVFTYRYATGFQSNVIEEYTLSTKSNSQYRILIRNAAGVITSYGVIPHSVNKYITKADSYAEYGKSPVLPNTKSHLVPATPNTRLDYPLVSSLYDAETDWLRSLTQQLTIAFKPLGHTVLAAGFTTVINNKDYDVVLYNAKPQYIVTYSTETADVQWVKESQQAGIFEIRSILGIK